MAHWGAVAPKTNKQQSVKCSSKDEMKMLFLLLLHDRGGTVFKVVCYKSEGLWFDPS